MLSDAFRIALEDKRLSSLPLLPLGGIDGKRPLINNWHRPGVLRAIRNASSTRFQNANVGLLTGPASRLTVVDIDDTSKIEEVFDRLGAPSFKVRTPRGGLHGYYRHSGEKNQISVIPGVDIRGAGGLAVIPPSRRPNSLKDDSPEGRAYRLLESDWSELPICPPIRDGGLEILARAYEDAPQSKPSIEGILDGSGGEQSFLWRQTMIKARTGCTETELVKFCIELAKQHNIVVTLERTKNLVASVVEKTQSGRNFVSLRGGDPIHRVVRVLKDDSKAGMLLAVLLSAHNSRSEHFAISPEAMQDAGLIAGWRKQRYRDARNSLVDMGILTEVHKGGRGKRDPSLYVFSIY